MLTTHPGTFNNALVLRIRYTSRKTKRGNPLLGTLHSVQFWYLGRTSAKATSRHFGGENVTKVNNQI